MSLLTLAQLDQTGKTALEQIAGAKEPEILEEIRVQFLGKKGAFSELMKGLGSLQPSERPIFGAKANEWKQKLEAELELKKTGFEARRLEEKLAEEQLDITLPARKNGLGTLHPVTQTFRKIISVFSRLGFDVSMGPEAETEFLNFDSVNVLKDHPARDMQDTFFLGPEVVLRTHTTPVQMRKMLHSKPPIRILCPGAVYRCDDDATHTPMFHQIEGLWVDQGVRMSDLKGVLSFFAQELFGSAIKIRLRPSYFPFVEPGAEVDVSCFLCAGKDPACRVCKGTGWLEILGAGMVHPKLFETAGYSNWKEQGLTGFAFGMGVDRISMILHGIPDLRLLFKGDTRFLKQF